MFITRGIRYKRYLGSQKGVKKVCLGLEGSSPARHLGPPPRIDLKFGSMDACRSRTARSRRVLRSWRPLRPLILARRARDVRAQRDRPMLGLGLTPRHYSKCRHRTSPKLEIKLIPPSKSLWFEGHTFFIPFAPERLPGGNQLNLEFGRGSMSAF